MNIEAAAALVRRTTESQGVPLHLDDPSTLAKVAALLSGAGREPVSAPQAETGVLLHSTTTVAAKRGGTRENTG